LRNYAFLGILALGELVVLISGGIDVSFMAVATVAQYLMGIVLTRYGIDSVVLAILLTLPIGAALGAVNAGLITVTKVHPVIVTIATLNVFYGTLIFFTGGSWIYNLPPSFLTFSQLKVFPAWGTSDLAPGVSVLTVLWGLAAVVTWFILNYLPIGRTIYALGGNAEAARRAGVNVFGVHLFVYTYMGALAGLAGFVQAHLTQLIQPNSMVGRELDVLAAAILGGASVFGGVGTMAGTVLGVITVAVIRNGLILMKVSSYWHEVVIGIVLAIAAAVTAYQARQGARRLVKTSAE
jgi:simple sugar transport system permease protein